MLPCALGKQRATGRGRPRQSRVVLCAWNRHPSDAVVSWRLLEGAGRGRGGLVDLGGSLLAQRTGAGTAAVSCRPLL